jgi:hypothetical protein
MKRYLLWPFTLTPLLLVGIFTILWVLAIHARLTGILMDVILFSWFNKYCFAFLDAIIAGAAEPPVMSVEMVNPFNEQRPIVLLALLSLDLSLVYFAATFSHALAVALGAMVIALLPANVAVLSLTSSMFHMVSPVTLVRLIRGWGLHYLWLIGGLLACYAALYGLWTWTDSVALLAAGSQLTFLLMFALVGAAVHEHRFALGIQTRTLSERQLERRAAEHAAARGAMLDHSYALLRLKRTAEAWSAIEAWIGEHGQDERGFAECEALLAATTRWDGPQIADRVADHYLGWLLKRGENGHAVDVLEQRVQANAAFRPTQPAVRLRLAELAAHAGKGSLSRTLKESS